MLTIVAESDPDCGVRLGGHQGQFPPSGTTLELFDATPAGVTQRVVMPRFGYLEVPTDRDVEIAIQTDQENWDDLLIATVSEATTELQFDIPLSESEPLVLVELVSDDFNADGRADIAAFYQSGVLAVYLQTGTGEFVNTLFEQGLDANVVDGTTGDFDANGTRDLAVVSQQSASSGLLRLYFNSGNGGPQAWSAGPSTDFGGVPRSIAPLGTGVNLKQVSRGVAITTDQGSTGEVARYETSASGISKTGGVEIGDEPGPSDPIEDENKKDPDPPIGVTDTAATLVGNGSARFNVLQANASGGFAVVEQYALPGRCIDFASDDLDGDGRPEVLVLTDNDALVLLRPQQQWTNGRAVSIPRGARSIAIGDIDLDAEPEVIIGTNDGFRIHAVRLAPTPGALGGDHGVYLELERTVDAGSRETDHLAAGRGGVSRLMTGFTLPSAAEVFAWRVEEISIAPCSAADLDGDGQAGSSDLGLPIAGWGSCVGCPADINGDGKVDGGDLAQIIAFWGPC